MTTTEQKSGNSSALREFGIKFGLLLGVFFGLLLPWLFSYSYPVWPWVIAIVLGLFAAARPALLAPVESGWMKIGLAIGKIMGPVFMGIVYFVVITPVALILKLLSKDPMNRDLSGKDASYRQPSEKQERERLERPY